jgi:cell division septation protein DedD
MSQKASKPKKASGSKKDPQSKKKASSKGSQFTVELTRKKLLFWLGVTFLAMVWMFTLGVLVGRGLSPVRFDVKKLKKELMALKQRALKTDQAHSNIETDKLAGDPELGFYEILTDKKKEARLKFAKADRPTVKLGGTSREAAGANEADKKDKIPLKVAELHKPTAKLNPTPPPPEIPRPEKVEREGLLTIQVASLNDAQKAREMVARLKSKGYEAYEVAVTMPGKKVYHRVRVGHFTDSNEVSQVAARLKRDKFEIMILRE